MLRKFFKLQVYLKRFVENIAKITGLYYYSYMNPWYYFIKYHSTSGKFIQILLNF